ncbi:recombinase family protein [Cellulosimicrobium sp. SL-1]|uniref:recombinase family protein n=1 Tax=Cellulosimicrobium sp. SL-1 TaxID=2699423 RepID=UPI0013D6E1F9|nr:recombinase family protein [Cellulosimicrobium sp. SL-1]
MGLRAAIYTRISSDRTGLGDGVARQDEDIRAYAERHDYEVVAEYVENDVGASTRSRKPRPLYQEMLRRAWAGDFDVIIGDKSNRLTRRPLEFEDLIALVEARGLRIVTRSLGDLNLNTSQGRAVARTLAAWDAQEAEETSERTKRTFQQKAEQGKRHGFVPYGWHVVDGQEARHPEQAAILDEVARRVLNRESIRSIVKDFNDRELPTPAAHSRPGSTKVATMTWNATSVRQLLLRERNAGLRTHNGKVIGTGRWEPLWSAEQQARLVALLTDPTRRTNRGAEVKHLLSGIAVCGLCGGMMRIVTGRQKPAYQCRECLRVRRVAEDVERLVTTVIVKRLAQPDAPALFGGDPEAMRAAEEEVDALQAQLARAVDALGSGDPETAVRMIERLNVTIQPKIADARARMRAAAPAPEFSEFVTKKDADDTPEQMWERAPLEKRRALIRHLFSVVIQPQGPGRTFDPEKVDIAWKVSTVAGRA